MLDQEDLQIINQFKEQNSRKKYIIEEEYKLYDMPDAYKYSRAHEAPTYELYLMDKIELSPEDEEAIDELGDKSGNTERVRHLTSQVMSSRRWYQSVYGIGFFEKFNMNELSWYIYDAAILMSKWESVLNWEHSLLVLRAERNRKGRWLLWLLAFFIFLFVGESFYADRSFQRILNYLLLSIITVFFAYRQYQKKQVDLSAIDDEIAKSRECIDWHCKKAEEHPLIQQQHQNSSCHLFETMLHYVNEGRASTLQEALNLYHQESQYNQLLRQQEATLQQTEQIHAMTVFNTIHNILKK